MHTFDGNVPFIYYETLIIINNDVYNFITINFLTFKINKYDA